MPNAMGKNWSHAPEGQCLMLWEKTGHTPLKANAMGKNWSHAPEGQCLMLWEKTGHTPLKVNAICYGKKLVTRPSRPMPNAMGKKLVTRP
ncbi:hypothetical protein RRG08_062430 [Elysia crispata]|uniref:Uncharacterized protein n=1 Tax=Elysia crispata TaxID=231223 RepID=A0AAE1DAP4_9GAST|nr:hypothetical protein RRG08_062430 [Elysia crispata]